MVSGVLDSPSSESVSISEILEENNVTSPPSQSDIELKPPEVQEEYSFLPFLLKLFSNLVRLNEKNKNIHPC